MFHDFRQVCIMMINKRLRLAINPLCTQLFTHITHNLYYAVVKETAKKTQLVREATDRI